MSQRALWMSRILTGLGVTAAARALLAPPARSRFVLVLHGVASRRYPEVARRAQPSHTAADLARTLVWLQPRYPFLTPADYFAGRRPGVLLTFDDGLANNYTQALPVLEQFGAPAVFFIATQHIANPQAWLAPTRVIAQRHWPAWTDVPRAIGADLYDGLSEAQLRALADHPLATIAAHTVTHPHLTGCSDDDLRREVTADRAFLEALLQRPIDYFAYPAGDYDRRVLEAVRAAGYRAAFAVDVRVGEDPRLEIPRIGLYETDPAYLAWKLSGLVQRPLSIGALGGGD